MEWRKEGLRDKEGRKRGKGGKWEALGRAERERLGC